MKNIQSPTTNKEHVSGKFGYIDWSDIFGQGEERTDLGPKENCDWRRTGEELNKFEAGMQF